MTEREPKLPPVEPRGPSKPVGDPDATEVLPGKGSLPPVPPPPPPGGRMLPPVGPPVGAPTPPGSGPGKGLIIGLLVALVIAVIAVGFLLFLNLRGSDDEPAPTASAPTVTEDAGSGGESTPAGSSDPVVPDDPAEPVDTYGGGSTPETSFYVDNADGWEAELPSGGDWSMPESVPHATINVTEVTSTDGTFAQVWSTPGEVPKTTLDGSDVAAVNYVAGGEEITFAAGVGEDFDPRCATLRCVDLLIQFGSGGLAILVGADTASEARRIARAIGNSAYAPF